MSRLCLVVASAWVIWAVAVPARAGQPEAPPAAAPPSAPTFVKWQDPREGAFTVDVPAQWKISGGTSRASPIDVRLTVRAASPDGRIRIFIDDPDIRPREVPNQMILSMGFREGQMIPGAVGQILLARYRTGAEFAQEYIWWKLCRQPVITHTGPQAEQTNRLNNELVPIGRSAGAAVKVTVGEAWYRCGTDVGYASATTLLAGPLNGGGVQIWTIEKLVGYTVDDASLGEQAQYLLNTMVASSALNPAWEQRQAQQTKDVTGAVTRMQQAMARNLADHARQEASLARPKITNPGVPTDLRKKWESEDRSAAARSHATMGTKEVRDPIQGSKTVTNEYEFTWTRPDGTTAHTRTDTPPDYSNGWRLMQEVK